MPKVWNIKDIRCPKDAVYCGRGSPYGNPYVMGKHGTRDEVIKLFEQNLLPYLDVSGLRGKDLKCFCKPKKCHCDSILIKANK